jgi:Luciferase-like monooxygenase
VHIMWFTERAYITFRKRKRSNAELLRRAQYVFRCDQGAALLNQYLDEKIYGDELGFDGAILNEHHGTPFCVGAVMDVEAAVLARATKRVKIVLHGNPIPTVANPLRLAEELAMIDMISGGRLVPGWVGGAGTEQLANNANPAYNREYFNEAHDVILAAWTKPVRSAGKGSAPLADRMTCLKLLGTEEMPAVREIGKELGLKDPFEVTPGSRPLPSSGKAKRVGSPEALAVL